MTDPKGERELAYIEVVRLAWWWNIHKSDWIDETSQGHPCWLGSYFVFFATHTHTPSLSSTEPLESPKRMVTSSKYRIAILRDGLRFHIATLLLGSEWLHRSSIDDDQVHVSRPLYVTTHIRIPVSIGPRCFSKLYCCSFGLLRSGTGFFFLGLIGETMLCSSRTQLNHGRKGK